LPNWSPIKPCIYHDIEMEIPQEFQGTVRKMYHVWLAYVAILAINCCAFILVWIIPNSGSADPAPAPAPTVNTGSLAPVQEGSTIQAISDAADAQAASRRRRDTSDDISERCRWSSELTMWWFSLVWFCVFSPASILWYRSIYKAFRDDSSFQFFLFFFIYFFQLIFHIVQAIGANDMGFGGWIQVFTFMGCSVLKGLIMLIPAIGFTGCAVVCVMQMIKIHDIYRSSGKNLMEAQKEWATGVMSNQTVQSFAQEAAADVMRNQASNVMSGR